MSKILSPALLKFQRKLYILSISFLKYFGIVYFWEFGYIWHILDIYIWHLYTTVWIRRFGLRLSIYFLKRISLCSRYVFFYYTITYLSRLELLRIELPKLTPSILMKSCDHSICPGWLTLFFYAPAHEAWFIFELDASSYSFKVNCILLRQVISLKNMVVT